MIFDWALSLGVPLVPRSQNTSLEDRHMRLSRRLSRVGLLMAALTLMGVAISIHASTINTSWKGGTGNWSMSADWTNGVPNNRGGNVYNATIDSGGTDVVTLDINATIASLVLGGTSGSSILENEGGKAESLEVTGATTINSTGDIIFGNSSTLKLDGGLTDGGRFNLSSATATITGSLTLKSGSSATVSGGSTLTVNGTLTNNSTSFETANGTGNKVTVNGGFSNSGSLFLFGTADTLTVTKTLTNNAGATLALETTNDVANIGMLVNLGSVTVATGTTLNLTNQATGITDVSAGSMLTVNGTRKPGSANGLAKLGSVEGTLNLGNGQTTADTPGGGTLTVASGGSLVLNNSGTTLSVNGALSDSGSVTLNTGATLNLTQGMSNLAGQLFLQNGKTTSITPSGGTMTLAVGSLLEIQSASGLTVNGNLTNKSTSFETANGTGNKVTVSGGFSNSGSLFLFGTADTLTVTKTLTNNAGATLALESSNDVANIGMLVNLGSVTVATGTTLNLTNQATGITDVSAGSMLTVNGTLKAGSANGLAKLGSVEGTLNLGNGQTTADTPGGGTLTVASGGSLVLNNSGTTLSVNGALSDSGSVTLNTGATLNLTQGMSNLAGQLFLQNGKTTSITPSGGTMTLAVGSLLEIQSASGLTVNGNLTNKSTSFETANGTGNKVTVSGGFSNSGSLFLFGTADTLTVTKTLTNNAGATLALESS